MCSVIGFKTDWRSLNVILPVGISFYTFQALSYTIDVYKNRIKATKDIIVFFAYISFFPQLVAGPIERATSLLPQFQNERYFEYENAVDGMRQMLWGFFKKLVIADNCAFVVNGLWNDYSELSGLSLIFLGILFSFQIYCDFSGYSDIAIGCARLFGISLRRNFDYPYFSRSIPEFWRRWHISLMTWFRDYIYIPLGGSRCSKWKVIRNIMIVFVISGLWHGANWTFICWGMYHACIIVLYYVFQSKGKNVVVYNIAEKITPSYIKMIQTITTFILVVIGWIIFRSESMSQFAGYIQSMSQNPFYDNNISSSALVYCGLGIIMMIAEWIQRDKQHALQFQNNWWWGKRYIRWSFYLLMYLLIVTSVGQNQSFLYFQF